MCGYVWPCSAAHGVSPRAIHRIRCTDTRYGVRRKLCATRPRTPSSLRRSERQPGDELLLEYHVHDQRRYRGDERGRRDHVLVADELALQVGQCRGDGPLVTLL